MEYPAAMLEKKLSASTVNVRLSAVRKLVGEAQQIRFLLGHSSIQTTERYLGSEQDLVVAVNDNLGL
jgi:hypothetical protein